MNTVVLEDRKPQYSIPYPSPEHPLNYLWLHFASQLFCPFVYNHPKFSSRLRSAINFSRFRVLKMGLTLHY